MRAILGGMAATVLLLFYLGVYRPTRSSFSGWWSVALFCAGLSTSLLLFNGHPLQTFTTPVSNMLAAMGVTGTWFAMLSLRHKTLPRWLLAVAPAVILVPTLLQNPSTNIWAGNGAMFSYMGLLFAAGSVEMWLAWRARRKVITGEFDNQAVVAFLVSAISSSLIALFYTMRAVLYFVFGPRHEVFVAFAGTPVTTGVLLVCLVAVTFCVATIGWDQQTEALRLRAMQDDLTGLLGRNAFRAHAAQALKESSSGRATVTLVMADLDHFKQVNDVHGHNAGDRALREFSSALIEFLKPGEHAGRLGGEEFALLLLGADTQAALARLDKISESFATRGTRFGFPFPTSSYGVTTPQPGDTVTKMFVRADFALYLAKTQGRNRAIVFSEEAGHLAALSERRTRRDDQMR